MNITDDDVARLLAKFTAAGWMHQTGIVGREGNLQPTEHGKKQLKEFVDGNLHAGKELGHLADGEILALYALTKDLRSRGLI